MIILSLPASRSRVDQPCDCSAARRERTARIREAESGRRTYGYRQARERRRGNRHRSDQTLGHLRHLRHARIIGHLGGKARHQPIGHGSHQRRVLLALLKPAHMLRRFQTPLDQPQPQNSSQRQGEWATARARQSSRARLDWQVVAVQSAPGAARACQSVDAVSPDLPVRSR